MLNKIKAALKDGTFFQKVLNKFRFIYQNIVRKTFEDKIEINPKKVLFLTFQGDYNCNPKAICDEFIREKKDYELVWVYRKECDMNQYPKQVKLVKRQSIAFYKEAASAKFIIDNANNFEYLHMKKKKGQYLFQPWHGAMGFKKLDPKSVKNDNWVNKALQMDEITDFCITNSKFEEEVFKTSYWPNTPFLKYGHPRNDMLFDNNGEFYKYTKKVKERYNISKDTKIALYAPTFRDNSSIESYNLDYSKLQKALEKKFGGKWVILLRFHFKLRKAKIPQKYLNNVVNVTDYPDMQELLCACDLGITDYSSWMCDYVLTRRPGFLFVSDIEDYKDERGFYYPLTSTPFKVCTTTEELVDAIKKYDEKDYQRQVDKFLKDRGCYEDGNASAKVVKKIVELTKKN